MKSFVPPACGVWILFVLASFVHAQENWPQFRGVDATGLATGNPPLEWSIEDGTNVAWKVPIAGLGHSAPIVWEDRVFITTAISSQDEKPSLAIGWEGGAGEPAPDQGDWTWKVICLDRNSGKEIWNRDAKTGTPTIKRHMKASHANCTPATDGKHVVAFLGSEGLYCYDYDGKLKWKVDLGRLHSGPYNAEELEWGFASSPVIHGDHVIVQCDCLNTGFVAILNLENGEEIRRIERHDVATWSTPCIFEWQGKTQIVCNGYKEMAGYDYESGERLWTLSGGGDVPVPTPLFHDGLIYLSNGHARSHCYAISPDAIGDISPDEDTDELPEGLAWFQRRGGSYMPTPIIVDDLHYTCDDRGVLTVRETKTGEEVYQRRVSEAGNNFTASAVATKNHIYFPAEKGDILVIKTGREYELVATNSVGEVVMSTPAIAGDQLFIRTAGHLVCISAQAESKAENLKANDP